MNITIPQDVIDDFAKARGYEETVLDDNGDSIPNPQSKGAYAKEQFKYIITTIVKGYRVSEATQTNKETIENTNIQITIE